MSDNLIEQIPESLNLNEAERSATIHSTYKSRAYNVFSSLPFGRIKKGSKMMKLADEIMYYKAVQKNDEQAIFFPRIFESYIGSYNWIIMENYAYPDLGKWLFRDPNDIYLTKLTWQNEFRALREILFKFSTWEDPQTLHNEENAEKMYIQKTEKEYEAFVESRDDLEKLFIYNHIMLNGQQYVNFHKIWEHIADYIRKNLLDYHSVMIHGDFCFSNILHQQFRSTIFYKFIDPRGSFGRIGIYGDSRYDVAKLMHSVDGGYEFFIYDHFRLRKDGPEFELKFTLDETKDLALAEFERAFFPKWSKKDIKLIQGLIYIGMCRRHFDNEERQLAMYCTGVRLLNEALALEK